MAENRRVPTLDEFLEQRNKEQGSGNAKPTNTNLSQSTTEIQEALNVKVSDIFIKDYNEKLETLVHDFISSVKEAGLDYKDADIQGLLGIAIKDALKKIK